MVASHPTRLCKDHPGELVAYAALIVLATGLVYVAAGAGAAAAPEGVGAGADASAQMMPRSIIREYQRLELAAGESSLERANAIAHVIMPPMSRGELVAAQALDAVLPRTALVSGARGLVSSPAARNTLAAGVGLTIALGTHTASARPRDGATGQGAATAQAVNFTRLFALWPYKLEEWDAGKSPRDLRMGERFQGSRCSREAAQGGFYLYLGLIQLT